MSSGAGSRWWTGNGVGLPGEPVRSITLRPIMTTEQFQRADQIRAQLSKVEDRLTTFSMQETNHRLDSALMVLVNYRDLIPAQVQETIASMVQGALETKKAQLETEFAAL